MEKALEEETEFRSWEEQAKGVLDEKGICDTVPDFIVANINKMRKTENTTLRQIAQPYQFPLSYDEVRDLCRLKWKFEHDSNYFSMSLPQLGIPKRAIIYYKPTKIKKIEPKDKYPVYVLLNPTYEPIKPPDDEEDDEEIIVDYEKCASVKEVCGLVPRFNHIKYRGYDTYGEVVKGKAFGFVSRCMQHEIDHLNGLLFTDQAQSIITIKEHRRRRDLGRLQFHLDL